VVRALVHTALHDPDPQVTATCAHAAGTYFNATAHETIVRAFRGASALDARRRAALALVEFLDAVSAPPPPRLRLVERDGGIEITGELGSDNQRAPSTTYEPLIEVVETGDDDLVRRAIQILFGGQSSAAAWSDVCER
jgi:HEAT repeat protein